MAQAIPFILLGASLVGSSLSAEGQKVAGESQAQAYEYNARVTEREAAQGEYESRERLRKLMGTQRSLYAKAGVDITSGSPLMQLAITAAEGEREALSIRQSGKEQATLDRFYGRQAKQAGRVGATSTFLTGLGNAGTSYFAAGGKIPKWGSGA